ncbi:hypothetical protein SASPL_101113 [Salvia splendens]|uniref:Protein kinase domain-containing protein n=1 Tax=Salvia splendens TaxID=180675 RepID=A0A8X9AC78_SALSN|nr:hypothetical protein SASPL_101113 [Salvia splendens]
MEETPPRRPPVAILLVLLLTPLPYSAVSVPINAPANSGAFTPPDNYLFDCGSPTPTTIPGNRVFVSDSEAAKFLAYTGTAIVAASPQPDPSVPSPIYNTASVFEKAATYTFHVTRPGWHWIRLHFAPVQNNAGKDLKTAKFKVTTDRLVLIQSFENPSSATWSMREFLVNVTTKQFSVMFTPDSGSFAYISAIEFTSAPDLLLGNNAAAVFPKGRNWEPDHPYLDPKFMGSAASIQPNVITYPEGGSPLIAPPLVYATATQMADANVQVPNFNITWRMKVDKSFQYFIRLHFADIVSKAVNELYFNVYINGRPAITGLDLSTVAGGLSAAYFADFVLNSSMVTGLDPLTVQVGPMSQNAGTKNALLNGIEVFKMNNSVGSLDGEFGVNGERLSGGVNGTVAAVGFAMMFGAFVGLGAMAVKWKKRPQDWQERNSFSSWLLPIHAGDASFLSGSKTSLGSRKSQVFSTNMGLGRYFSFAELQEATNNWESCGIIGVGGFGNVYLGTIDDGLKVAVKRGNPQSEQGINEFQTEIQILSKLRHRHLVSLIGYCDENAEMILVYEFMANGPLRDHLYGKDLPTLSLQQRLEVCIGAARGLHYLHTGAAQGIIHRDVKSTNILLDENLWKRKGLLDKIIDPTLVDHISPESLAKFAEAAEKCLAEYGVDRPSMGDVLWNLEYSLQMQESWLQEHGDVEKTPFSPHVVVPTIEKDAPTSAPEHAADIVPPSTIEEGRPQGEAQAIEEHSGTAMFAQFAALNGR